MGWASTDYSLAKCRETYGMNNAVGFPHEDRRAGRPTRCNLDLDLHNAISHILDRFDFRRVTPIHDRLLGAGAFMAFSAGWESPDWYSEDGRKAEYKPSFRR